MSKMTMDESQFISLMRQVVNEAITPRMHELITAEVNRQMKRLIATLVAGLIRK